MNLLEFYGPHYWSVFISAIQSIEDSQKIVWSISNDIKRDRLKVLLALVEELRFSMERNLSDEFYLD